MVTTKIKTRIPINLEFFSNPLKIDLFLPTTRALNIFHQFMHIYVAKKIVRFIPSKKFASLSRPHSFKKSVCSMPKRIVRHSAQINPPKPKIALPNDLFMINSFLSLGLSKRTFSSAGSDARAMAASESITRFIQRNCVTVNGMVMPTSGLNTAIRHAEMLIESCR